MELKPNAGAPAASQEPAGTSVADGHASWLSAVQRVLRRAFHSDARIGQDAMAKASARSMRTALEEAAPRDRFAVAVQVARTCEPSMELEQAAADLCRRRIAVRDHLVGMLGGLKPHETWDEIYYRAIDDLAGLDRLGRELARLGVMCGPTGGAA